MLVNQKLMDDWELHFREKSSRRYRKRKREERLKAIVMLALIGAIVAASVLVLGAWPE
jgi:hypothetical protein